MSLCRAYSPLCRAALLCGGQIGFTHILILQWAQKIIDQSCLEVIMLELTLEGSLGIFMMKREA